MLRIYSIIYLISLLVHIPVPMPCNNLLVVRMEGQSTQLNLPHYNITHVMSVARALSLNNYVHVTFQLKSAVPATPLG